MPQFAGTQEEKRALAAYLYRELQGKVNDIAEASNPEEIPLEIPEFDKKNDEYVLLVWNDLGMHCISDNEKYFSFLPPANTLNAQLFRRGEKPEIIKSGITMVYEVEAGYENPQNHSMFWDYDKQIFGLDLPEGTGLMGKRVKDTLDAVGNIYAAHLIPVVPYKDGDVFNPYPLFSIRAIDNATGEIIAETKAVAPTSTEMGCRNCHEGGWRWNNISGVSDLTAQNILRAHDRYNKTTLLDDAENGNPVLCQSCHADPAVMAPGKSGVLNFSSAMHGFHANYMTGMMSDACSMCHPAKEEGNTSCFRGRHSQSGLSCIECHGVIGDHALGLLANQSDIDASARLSAGLEPLFVTKKSEIIPRTPWLMEPDCRSCHTNFDIWEDGYSGTAFNNWVPGFAALYRNRTDNQGVMCSACHGSTHAVYGAVNKYGRHRDNLQPLQYQGVAGTIGTADNCDVCHTVEMNFNGHHRNMVNRNTVAYVVE